MPGLRTTSATDFGTSARWNTLPSGKRCAKATLSSPGVINVRMAIDIEQLPANAIVRFYGAGFAGATEYQAADIAQLRQKHRDNGLSANDARQLFSPLFAGQEASVEIELPASANTNDVIVGNPQLREIRTVTPQDSCHQDVPTGDAVSQSQSRSVARVLFKVGTDGLTWCTGTLLNNSRGDQTPYFITAHHCISDAVTAASVSTLWTTPQGVQEVTGGAKLIYTSSHNDTTLLKLNNPPPAGAVFSGFDSGFISLKPTGGGTSAVTVPVTGIHHPRGGPQRYSAGNIATPANISWIRGIGGEVALSTLHYSHEDSSNFLGVYWNAGRTEKGSSGSGLFVRKDGKDYLVGVLTGGKASCTARTEPDAYGRLSHAWNDPNDDSLRKALKPD